MPGLPSTSSEIESPTGCTKQLIRVACRATPAAELMRPAGMKPSSCACRKRRSQVARRSSGSAWARARATRRRTASTLASSPLAYFSSRVSRQIDCSATRGASARCSMCYWVSIQYSDYPPNRALPQKTESNDESAACLRDGLAGRGRRFLRAARLLEQVGDLGMAHAQRELHRRAAFLRYPP